MLFCQIVALGALASAQAPASQPESQPASTQPGSAPDETPRIDDGPPSAIEVKEAPLPNQSSGLLVAEPAGVGDHLLWVPRILLYVPRRAIELVFMPLRGLSYCWERFRVPERFKEIFFNEAGSFGVFPVAFVDTGFGLNAGVRMIHRDMLGEKESLLLRASFGGRYQQFYSGSIDSGRRLGRFKLKLVGGYHVGPQDHFYGIGNADLVSRESLDTEPRIDPLTDDTAVDTIYRKDLAFAKLSLITRIIRGFSATLSTEVRYQSFDRKADENDIGDFYQTERLATLEHGSFDLYPQLRLTFDNRTVAHPYMSSAMSSSGLYLNGWLGYARGFQDDPSNHLRYALDLQWFIDLYRGDRVLILRVVLDGVTAELSKIPFNDLPDLGGDRLLRGYPFFRFRDRALTLGSAEYQYNLSSMASAFVFIDTGRVWRTLRDFGFNDYRMGFGGGLLLHTRSSFLARVQLASSIDGGFFVNFSLDPVYDTRAKGGS